MYRLYPLRKSFIQKHFKSISTLILTLIFTAASLFSSPAFATSHPTNTRLDNWGDTEMTGSSWLNGSGVDIYSNGSTSAGPTPDTYNCVAKTGHAAAYGCAVNQVSMGIKWQCVEMINRLYYNNSWISDTWAGNGNQMYANASVGTGPNDLTKQGPGSVSKVQVGDVISLDYTDGLGHAGVVSAVGTASGSSIPITLKNQNTIDVTSSATWNKTTKTITMSGGWSTYTFVGIIHRPANALGSTYGYQAAFNSGNLWLVGAGVNTDTTLPMAAGTSPSITKLATGGYEVAFQHSNGNLYMYGSAGTFDTTLGMAAGTSPSITYKPGGGYEVAFQANTGKLYMYGSMGSGTTVYGMVAGTSPAITTVAASPGYQVAFNSGNVWLYGSVTSNTGMGMVSGTSPAITGDSGSYQVGFNSGNLWTFGVEGTVNSGYGMVSTTSPTLGMVGGHYRAAFNSGDMWLYGPSFVADSMMGMVTGTNPALTDVSAGFETALNSGNMWLYGDAVSGDTSYGLATGTSPAITKQ